MGDFVQCHRDRRRIGVMTGLGSDGSALGFVALSSAGAELQADKRPTVIAETKSKDIKFFFISPPGWYNILI